MIIREETIRFALYPDATIETCDDVGSMLVLEFQVEKKLTFQTSRLFSYW